MAATKTTKTTKAKTVKEVSAVTESEVTVEAVISETAAAEQEAVVENEAPVAENTAEAEAIAEGIEAVREDIAATIEEVVNEAPIESAVEETKVIEDVEASFDATVENLNKEITANPEKAPEAIKKAQKELREIKKVISGKNNFTGYWNGININW